MITGQIIGQLQQRPWGLREHSACPHRYGEYPLGRHSKGVDLDKELYAIASMVQWIFRGSVRKKEKMYLIMPSKEMRDLYFKWLETSDEELVK